MVGAAGAGPRPGDLPVLRFRHGWSPLPGYLMATGSIVILVVAELLLPGGTLGERIQGAAVCLGMAAVALRWAQMGPYFTPRGVKVIEMWRTSWIPWRDVRSFVLRPHGTAKLQAHALLTDGTVRWIPGVGSSYRFATHSSGAEETVRHMNEALGRYRDAECH